MYIIYRVCIKYRETFHIMNIGQNIDRDTKIVVSLSPTFDYGSPSSDNT